MKIRTTVMGLGALLGCEEATPPPEMPAPPATAEWDDAAAQELRAAADTLHDALAKGDFGALRTLMADDGYLTSYDIDMEGKPVALGTKDEAIRWAEQMFAALKQAGGTMEVKFRGVQCRATATFGLCASEGDFTATVGGKSMTMSGRTTEAARKGPDGWKWTHYHFSLATLPPPPPPPPPPAAPTYDLAALNKKDLKWVSPPGAPPGMRVAVVSGDPTNGPHSAFVEFPAKTSVPRHYHSANLWAFVVKGSLKTTLADGRVIEGKEGGAALVPGKTIHTTESRGGCVMYQVADGKHDIVFVDDKGDPLPGPPPPPAPPEKKAGKKGKDKTDKK